MAPTGAGWAHGPAPPRRHPSGSLLRRRVLEGSPWRRRPSVDAGGDPWTAWLPVARGAWPRELPAWRPLPAAWTACPPASRALEVGPGAPQGARHREAQGTRALPLRAARTAWNRAAGPTR